MRTNIALLLKDTEVAGTYKRYLETDNPTNNVVIHRVTERTSSDEVVNMVRADQAKMIFLDVNYTVNKYPGDEYGLRDLKALRAHPMAKDIPIAMVSGSGEYADRCKQSGAKAYVQNPVEIKNLAALVRVFAKDMIL